MQRPITCPVGGAHSSGPTHVEEAIRKRIFRSNLVEKRIKERSGRYTLNRDNRHWWDISFPSHDGRSRIGKPIASRPLWRWGGKGWWPSSGGKTEREHPHKGDHDPYKLPEGPLTHNKPLSLAASPAGAELRAGGRNGAQHRALRPLGACCSIDQVAV
jgi:hypothetical protein